MKPSSLIEIEALQILAKPLLQRARYQLRRGGAPDHLYWAYQACVKDISLDNIMSLRIALDLAKRGVE